MRCIRCGTTLDCAVCPKCGKDILARPNEFAWELSAADIGSFSQLALPLRNVNCAKKVGVMKNPRAAYNCAINPKPDTIEFSHYLNAHSWPFDCRIVTSITFLDSLKDVPEQHWDISAAEDGSVAAWIVKSKDSDETELMIAGASGVTAPESCACLFAGFEKLRSIHSMDLFITAHVKDMCGMFAECINLTALELNSFDTSDVTNMCGMFLGCGSLTSMNLSNFNTSAVTDMSWMFGGCESLETLGLTNFDTSSTTNMRCMFNLCRSLTALDLSSFNTSAVTDMGGMFIKCISLKVLDLRNFDTSVVTDMSSMFLGCRNLTLLNLNSFDTSSVTDMCCMFSNCSNLTKLGLSGFNISSVKQMRYMFYGCYSLTVTGLISSDNRILQCYEHTKQE